MTQDKCPCGCGKDYEKTMHQPLVIDGQHMELPEGSHTCSMCSKVSPDYEYGGMHIEIVHNETGRYRSHWNCTEESDLPSFVRNHPDWAGFTDNKFLDTMHPDHKPWMEEPVTKAQLEYCETLGAVFGHTKIEEFQLDNGEIERRIGEYVKGNCREPSTKGQGSDLINKLKRKEINLEETI